MARTRDPRSITSKVLSMEVGDVLWVETTEEKYPVIQRAYNFPMSRRPDFAKSWVIECSLYQAVRVSQIGTPYLLVRVERVK